MGIQTSVQVSPSRAVKIDEEDAATTYIGISTPGADGSAAVWQMRRILVTGTVTDIEFADGDADYGNIWDNRAALSYS